MSEQGKQQRVLVYSHPLLGLPGVTPENLRAMGVRADPAERVLRRLVEKRGLNIADAITKMIICAHPGNHEWDDASDGGSEWECTHCGFSLYLPHDFTSHVSTDHADWPDKVQAIARQVFPDFVIEGGEEE